MAYGPVRAALGPLTFGAIVLALTAWVLVTRIKTPPVMTTLRPLKRR